MVAGPSDLLATHRELEVPAPLDSLVLPDLRVVWGQQGFLVLVLQDPQGARDPPACLGPPDCLALVLPGLPEVPDPPGEPVPLDFQVLELQVRQVVRAQPDYPDPLDRLELDLLGPLDQQVLLDQPRVLALVELGPLDLLED